MKKVLILGFLSLMFIGCATWQEASAARAGEVIVSYDDMTETKRMEVFIDKTNFELLQHNFEQFTLLVVEKKEILSYYICFNLHYRDWWFIDRLLIKVGNEEPIYLEAGANSRDTYSILDYVGIQEWVIFQSSKEMFEKAATTDNIRLRIIGSKNQRDYAITPEDQIIIKRLLAAI